MKKLKITLVKSPISSLEKHIRTVEALGLRKLHQSVVHDDTPSIRGMIFVVKHMVTVEEIDQ
ncbi:MAG: 50S ribosomal protein L30 [Christensenellales bacterium]|jgi:large subunit ribosomal protein L30|uniref:Large ribosomal subunit protein uL30 n=1 Tax=Candidatus Avichristensenella intestinipullorum TaxID=2840693 RepID=A0A9D1CI90_9FIRM|nr:50S ribosomal protein L30 [Christensenellales bacterium]HIQ62422.1 50S ribosomal protein L30 [Candidatus Avichristensenella intestinipullorum]